MQVASTIADARAAIAAARREGKRIGFVPTMGFLHEGHLSLADEARRRADFVVMSIFVNPLQFAPTEDLSRYPRDPEGDAAKARHRGVSLLFTPAEAEMYPRVRRVEVVPRALHERWEGAIRPGHFAGVLTAVTKLFHIVAPDVAVFGQKDVQQAALVRALVADLDLAVEIVVGPTIREPDGLAMSSRNSYLGVEERRRATVLARALVVVRDAFQRGESAVAALELAARATLDTEPSVAVDYVAIVDGDTLEPVGTARSGSVVLLAARVGRTRLIDNLVLGP